ncbi:MAG: single-stranded DNA-binding protein [Patescibacteria group bacterium]
MNLNKVFVLGRLTADPQLRTTPSGQSVTSFSIATNRVWNDKNGARQEEVEYHNIVVWGRQAEVASQFLTKGSVALIEGRIRTRSWQDKQGQNRKTTEIICERLQLGPRPGRSGESNFPKQGQPDSSVDQKQEADIPVIDIGDNEEIKAEDLPF